MFVGVPTLAVIIALSIKIMASRMFNANVEIHFALDAEVNLIALVIASKQRNGNLRILQRVRILHGSWLILSNAQNAENLLRKIKVVTI